MSEQKKAMNMNVSNTLHSIRSLYKLLYSYGDRDTQNTVKHLIWSVYKKNIMPECSH